MAKTKTSTHHDARKPTDADRFVGQQLRQGRRELGLTQDALAPLIGVTLQQIQKYEAGHSRMAAGRLRDVAIALKKPITFFYAPFDHAVQDSKQAKLSLRLKDLRRDAKKQIDAIKDPEDLEMALRLLEGLATQS